MRIQMFDSGLPVLEILDKFDLTMPDVVDS